MKAYYRPTIAKIYLNNLIYNYMQFRKLLPESVEIAPVIKADAYGHGAVICAKELSKHGVKTFCVAFIDEAAELRKAGIEGDILLLGSTKKEFAEHIIELNLIPAVFEYKMALALNEACKAKGKSCAVHIKVDTGMGRIGLAYEDAVKEIIKISRLENITIQGIFSHYSSADEKDKTYTNLQKSRFLKVLDELGQAGIKIPVKHIANSAASIDIDQFDMNMIRLGISLYGYYPSREVIKNKVSLKPVMELQTEIAYIKNVKKGESISYNRQFTAPRDMTVATLPIGYADGYRREFKNKAFVEINGCKALVIGTVCMDQIMIDITDIKNVKKDDTAILFGTNTIGADDLADISNTISYEILCGISKRVPRVYVKNN